jgi:hypothetical protein
VQLIGEVLLDPAELLGRNHVCRVELARAVLAQLGAGVGDVHEMHSLEPGGAVVPVVRVAPQDHVRAKDPVLEDESPVRDELAGARIFRAIGRERGAVHRERRRLGKQTQQVRGRGDELDAQRHGVGSADAERIGLHFARRNGGRVHDGLDGLRIRRAGRRIDEPTQASDVIGRRDRIAVRPAQAWTQLENVFETVWRNRPGLRRRWYGAAVRPDGRQALEHIPQDIEGCIGASELRVQRVGLGPVAPPQHRGVVALRRSVFARGALTGSGLACATARLQQQHGCGCEKNECCAA